VHVVSDRLAELGAEDDDAFLSIQELTLLGENEFPFRGGRLVNATPPSNAALARLPAVDGITVNTVHGNERSIAAVARRFNPQVESMEGAAFMYSCLVHGLPFAQVRAVSNVVERRNRGAWKLADAIGNLGEAALDILDHA
jgi:futalosine hydrolase